MRRSALPWALLPVAAYFVLLTRLWADVPVMDDYDAILAAVHRMQDAGSLGEWSGWLFALHNEHRIASTRFVAWAAAEGFGRIDFRYLLLLGNLQLVGVLALAWSELRSKLDAPMVAAAGLLLLQMSYYEAVLMSMAALSNIGVVFAAFACLLCALRDFRGAAASSAAFGILAALSQGNGIFALPLAAAGCALSGRRRRALVLAAVTAAVWVLYFHGYARPGHHPSPLAAFERPLETAHLFLVIVGGIVPGERSVYAGGMIVTALAALTWKGFWRGHPVVALWVVFLLGSAAAAAAARVGFGVYYASRYAVNSSCLLMLAVLAWATYLPQVRRGAWLVAIVVGSAIVSGWVTTRSWRDASAYAAENRRLVKVHDPDGTTHFEGARYPAPEVPDRELGEAERRGVYRVKREVHLDLGARAVASWPETSRRAGFVDAVKVHEDGIVVTGWVDLAASDAGRTLVLRVGNAPTAVSAEVVKRSDVADGRKDARLEYAGFRLVAEYPSLAEAERAAATACVAAESARERLAVLYGGACGGPAPEAEK